MKIIIQDHEFFLEKNGEYFEVPPEVNRKQNRVIYTFTIEGVEYKGETIEEVNKQLLSDMRDKKISEILNGN